MLKKIFIKVLNVNEKPPPSPTKFETNKYNSKNVPRYGYTMYVRDDKTNLLEKGTHVKTKINTSNYKD